MKSPKQKRYVELQGFRDALNSNKNTNFRNKYDFIKWFRTDLDNPLAYPLIILVRSAKYRKKLTKIFRKLRKTLQDEIKRWKIKTINCNQIKKWINKSASYSFYVSYGTRSVGTGTKLYKKLFRNLYRYINLTLKRYKIEVEFKHKTFSYGPIAKYIEQNYGQAKKAGPRNKILIKSNAKHISIMETFSIMDNPLTIRTMRKGAKMIEIWDTSVKIKEWIQLIRDKKNTLNQELTVYKFNDENNRVIEVKGTQRMVPKIPLKIMTLNVGGLNKPGKKETLESFLIQENIDIAMIQETKLPKAIYLRSYNSISKKAYKFNEEMAGGLAIIFKPFLKHFVTEKLITNQDFMGINLNNIQIINCYGRQNEDKKHKGLDKSITVFKNKVTNLCNIFSGTSTIITGDFNLDKSELEELKQIKNNKFKITRNQRPTRTRDIDHIITSKDKIELKRKINRVVTTPEITYQNKTNNLSDHKAVINTLLIDRDLEITPKFACYDEQKFQEEFTRTYRKIKEQGSKFTINDNTFREIKKKFERKVHNIQNLSHEDYQITEKLIELINNPYINKSIRRDQNKSWNKIINRINEEYQTNNIAWWRHYGQFHF
ncbi:ap endonuclease [Anaeramoeba flamelloides]|uniref:Ap endonuclease n=1 Tax=Anaeramoeba flamelloides TaxID=1746091 RepID=A0ABQ8YYC4_9EUKA|nr:ap endonuclease [Anaeramoeba flamelloides]